MVVDITPRNYEEAIAWASAQGSFYPVDNCMRFVIMAFGLFPSDVMTGHDYDSAMEGWSLAQSKQYSRSVPRGMVAYFYGPSGHTCISLGDGTFISSGIGVPQTWIGTLEQIERATKDPYLGYADNFNGIPIGKPLPPKRKTHNMPTMIAKSIGVNKWRFIMSDGNHKATTENLAESNNWLFAYCGGDASAIVQADNPLKLAAFNYLDALPLPPFGMVGPAADVKAINDHTDQVGKTIIDSMPTKLVGTLGK